MAKIRRKKNYKRATDGSIYIAGEGKSTSNTGNGSPSISPFIVTVSNSDAEFKSEDDKYVYYTKITNTSGSIVIPSNLFLYEYGTYGVNNYIYSLYLTDSSSKFKQFYSNGDTSNHKELQFKISEDAYESRTPLSVGDHNAKLALCKADTGSVDYKKIADIQDAILRVID